MTSEKRGKTGSRRLGLALSAESIVRNILLFGFLVLLLLIAAIGYWSLDSLNKVRERVAQLHQTEANHLRLILRVKETAARMDTEARMILATLQNPLLHFPTENKLNTVKRQMDSIISDLRLGTLDDTEEWKSFEAAYNDYLSALSNPDAPDWSAKRDRMIETANLLEDYALEERSGNDMKADDLGRLARRRILTVTGSALLVGLLIVILTFYEIQRILSQNARAYEESAESRDYLQSLLDSLVSGVVVVGRDGKVQTISDSFRGLTGRGVAQGKGTRFEELFNGVPSLIEGIRDTLEKETQGSRYYERIELAEGHLFDIFSSPLIIAEEHRGLILVFVDITESEQAQAELRRNRALSAIGQMTAQIAHEIKNPLGSIRFATELLKRSGSNGSSKDEEKTLEVIERSVDHLAAIVTELSEFARPKELNISEVNLNQLLEELVPMVADRLSKCNVSIEKSLAADGLVGRFDAIELRKLFLNLIINAIEACEPGGTVKIKTSGESENSVLVEISDNGSGMDPETLRRLFEPFYTTKSTGTGLGMAIARKIAELHRGDLRIRSKLGAGTVASVRLPRD
ncbi:MAG TPA: ATP-binding protein [Blastocatellia bacterium]|jgi:PAS domain S-box-containing protein|nr:ATP-binding protein [Blastocatellia bacterium]